MVGSAVDQFALHFSPWAAKSIPDQWRKKEGNTQNSIQNDLSCSCEHTVAVIICGCGPP